MVAAKGQGRSSQEVSLDSVSQSHHQTPDQPLAIIAKAEVVSLALSAQSLDTFFGYSIDCLKTSKKKNYLFLFRDLVIYM